MIDIKTLHIGSHVYVGGKRVRICGITKRKIGYHATSKPCEHLQYARLNEVEPIQITQEMLTELGFIKEPNVDKKRNFEYLWISKEENCDVCWIYGEKDNFFLLQSGAFGQIHVKYLHEAEAFLALHGVELIKEQTMTETLLTLLVLKISPNKFGGLQKIS